MRSRWNPRPCDIPPPPVTRRVLVRYDHEPTITITSNDLGKPSVAHPEIQRRSPSCLRHCGPPGAATAPSG